MNRTILHSVHVASGARLVEFGGWEMPVQYRDGIIAEHLATRRHAGLFDVSHMGRIEVSGAQALPFLLKVLSNDASRLSVGASHYTLLATESGGALDDAWLCCFEPERFLLVVNASNRAKDWDHLTRAAAEFPGARLTDVTERTAMLSLQGPESGAWLAAQLTGALPAARRNACAVARFGAVAAYVSRTGYTGEPVGFEVIVDVVAAASLWAGLVEAGAAPVGLGARDTLRLEAGLPLYGHELGAAHDGSEIPVMACPTARFGVSLASTRGDFIGRAALAAQAGALAAVQAGAPADRCVLPRRIFCLALQDKGIARAGAEVYANGRCIGHVTSGTMVPYWEWTQGKPGERWDKRAIALALLELPRRPDDVVAVRVRERDIPARVVERFLDSRTVPFAVPVLG